MRARPFGLSVALIVTTISAGLTVRLARLGLPTALVKYGGSMLWALMVYWIVSAVRPHWLPKHAAVASAAIAVSIELFKHYHAPSLDAFRLSLPGRLILGRVFSTSDLLAYGAAIVAGSLADCAIRSR